MPEGIEIQHGCIESYLTPFEWLYVETRVKPGTTNNESERISYPFTSIAGTKPEIGDFIVNGILVKRDKPKVNTDWSKWKDKDLYGNP